MMYDDSEAGKLTEQIMRYFWQGGQMPLDTPEYNKLWSHVNSTVRAFLGYRCDRHGGPSGAGGGR